MRYRLSCFFPEAARDLDQHDQHRQTGNDEVAQDGSITMQVADDNRTDAHVAVDCGVSDEGKLAARETPGEGGSAGGNESEKPQAVARPIDDSGEQRPKENVGCDVQIGAEEMRLQAAALGDGSGYADDQAVENRILPVGCVLMRRPVRDRESEPSGE